MNARLGWANGLSWFHLLRSMATVLLAVLAISAPLSGQTDEQFTGRLHFFPKSTAAVSQPALAPGDKPGDNATDPPSQEALVKRAPADFNPSIFYKNKLEVSLEGGWLPNNIPFVFDRFVGIYDRMTPLHYTLVPFIASVRWQMTDIGGFWIFRGNWDLSFSGSYTMIPRGPETRFFSYIMGIRRNFIQPRWRIVPYFEGRAGIGDINAKEPYGAPFAQGQDLTFTVMLGGGARYNFSPRYAVSAGVGYMHISNLYLSEPKYLNYGINVYGPMVGAYMRLGNGERHSSKQAMRR
jgi:Lipid A 3-O-deacylase (PagL)